MLIYIIRHGETDANRQGRLQGWDDWPLNLNGIALAEEAGKALRGVHFDAAFSSSLCRAKETAEIVLRESGNNLPIRIDDRIKELNVGDMEGKTMRGEHPEIDPAVSRAFFYNAFSFPSFPNGESIQDGIRRTQEFLKELASKEEYNTVLVATHGCALRCMLNFLYEDKNDFWHGHVPLNCCINIVEAKDGDIRLIKDDWIPYSVEDCVDLYTKF